MTHDFSDLTPPPELKQEWRNATDWRRPDTARSLDPIDLAARWGAEQAAERLANQWPDPIADRPPTEADADDYGWVAYKRRHGAWDFSAWERVADLGDPWHHTPRWQPPAPPPLTPQQQQALAALDNLLQHCTDNTGEAVIRRAILGGEA